MDLKSYIELKETYTAMNSPVVEEEITWEEIQGAAEILVSEGHDLSGFEWEEFVELYITEKAPEKAPENDLGARSGRALSNMGGDLVKGTWKGITNMVQGKPNNAQTNPASARQQKRLGNIGTFLKTGQMPASGSSSSSSSSSSGVSKAEQERLKNNADVRRRSGQQSDLRGGGGDTKNKPDPKGGGGGGGNGGGGGGRGGSGGGGGSSTPAAKPKPAAQTGNATKDMASWAKANPKLAAAKAKRDATRGTSATTNPLMKDLKARMPKPAAPKPTTTATPSPAASKPAPTPAAKPASRLDKALSSVKPMKEGVDAFDLILSHLVEQGFGPDEAMKLMVNMPEEKRAEILEMRHRDAKTGEVTDKPEIGKTYYPEGPRAKSSVALRKEKEAAEKKKTQKESLLDAYASMYVAEEESDARKDRRQERGGVDGNVDYKRPTKEAPKGEKKGETPLQKAAREKYGKDASPMDIVKAKIKAQYGEKSIADTKKKDAK